MKNFYFFFFFIYLIANQALAHGEDKLGPHNGYIRMPGAFHTEVVPAKNGIKIMLLDIQFQHPSIKNSSMQASIKKAKKIYNLACKARRNYFFCPVKEGLLSQKGTLQIIARRENSQGVVVNYPLPLRLDIQR